MDKEKKAEEIYKNKLKLVETVVGRNTTWLSDLERLGKRLFGVKFHGVYPSDRIPKLTDLRCYCILNTDKSGEPGSHWVALAKNGSKVMFYDSFGRKGKDIMPTIRQSGNGRLIDTDRDKEQRILETNCGARCLAWLWVYDDCGSKVAKLI